jgi:hypothetical protein
LCELHRTMAHTIIYLKLSTTNDSITINYGKIFVWIKKPNYENILFLHLFLTSLWGQIKYDKNREFNDLNDALKPRTYLSIKFKQSKQTWWCGLV